MPSPLSDIYCSQRDGNYYNKELSRYFVLYIATILRPFSCSVRLFYIYLSIIYTAKPVLSGPVLNGHPLLSGQL